MIQLLRQLLQPLYRQLNQQPDQQLDQQLDRLTQQLGWFKSKRLYLKHSTALETIARRRLDLYITKSLSPDPVALSLFLSPHNRDLLNDARRLILELFSPVESAPSLPSDATKSEASKITLWSDFFESEAIGDLTKWRLLASVVFPEWETLSAQWKNLLAAEVLRVTRVSERRVDWMARVTPLLEGEFDLYEFGLAKDDGKYGRLTTTHLHIIVTVVEHLRAEELTHKGADELENLLGQHSNILCDEQALCRIRGVIRQAQKLDS